MVERRTRVCPDCGNDDGAKVERTAFNPTFQCECGYTWDRSNTRFVGLWNVDWNATDEELDVMAEVIAARMNSATVRGED
jgi:hypothetical protein